MVSLLGMLMAVYGVAGNMVYANIGILNELESFDIEEDNEVNVFDIPSWTNERGCKVLVNVDSFGAVGDGVSDDTQVRIHSCIFGHFLSFKCTSFINLLQRGHDASQL